MSTRFEIEEAFALLSLEDKELLVETLLSQMQSAQAQAVPQSPQDDPFAQLAGAYSSSEPGPHGQRAEDILYGKE